MIQQMLDVAGWLFTRSWSWTGLRRNGRRSARSEVVQDNPLTYLSGDPPACADL